MITFLEGILVERQPTRVVMNVNGVGYELEAPMSTFYELPGVGEEVRLVTHLLVRDDANRPLATGFTKHGLVGRDGRPTRMPEGLRRHHPRALQFFLREAQSAARLNHPNIVTVYDADQQDGQFFITMELLEGQPLQTILHERAQLGLLEATGRMPDRLRLRAVDVLSETGNLELVERFLDMVRDRDDDVRIAALNALGDERWEAFWVQESRDGLRVFMKRSSISYLSRVPVGSLIRMLSGGQ